MKNRKFELQNKLIERLQRDVLSKDAEIAKLKAQNASLRMIAEKAGDYEKEHVECIRSLYEAKRKYEEAVQEVMMEKIKYKAQMEWLFGDVG